MKKLASTALKILIGLFIVAFSSVAYTNDAPKSASSPVKIQSDGMKYFGNEKKSEFSGNVIAVSDDFTLTADHVTVFLNADMDVDKIICKGNVNFKNKDVISISEDAEVDQTIKTAVLSGGVKVWQGENFLEGDKVIMYYTDNRIIVDKGTDRRVTIIFRPDDKEKPFDAGSKKP